MVLFKFLLLFCVVQLFRLVFRLFCWFGSGVSMVFGGFVSVFQVLVHAVNAGLIIIMLHLGFIIGL